MSRILFCLLLAVPVADARPPQAPESPRPAQAPPCMEATACGCGCAVTGACDCGACACPQASTRRGVTSLGNVIEFHRVDGRWVPQGSGWEMRGDHWWRDTPAMAPVFQAMPVFQQQPMLQSFGGFGGGGGGRRGGGC